MKNLTEMKMSKMIWEVSYWRSFVPKSWRASEFDGHQIKLLLENNQRYTMSPEWQVASLLCVEHNFVPV